METKSNIGNFCIFNKNCGIIKKYNMLKHILKVHRNQIQYYWQCQKTDKEFNIRNQNFQGHLQICVDCKELFEFRLNKHNK